MQIAADLLFLLVWVAFYIYWLVSAWITRSPVKRKQSRFAFLSYGGVWVVIWVILVTVFVPDLMSDRIIPAGIGFTIAGLIITVAGLAFAIWARVHLGKNWSGMPVIREEHTITRTGPVQFCPPSHLLGAHPCVFWDCYRYRVCMGLLLRSPDLCPFRYKIPD